MELSGTQRSQSHRRDSRNPRRLRHLYRLRHSTTRTS